MIPIVEIDNTYLLLKPGTNASNFVDSILTVVKKEGYGEDLKYTPAKGDFQIQYTHPGSIAESENINTNEYLQLKKEKEDINDRLLEAKVKLVREKKFHASKHSARAKGFTDEQLRTALNKTDHYNLEYHFDLDKILKGELK